MCTGCNSIGSSGRAPPAERHTFWSWYPAQVQIMLESQLPSIDNPFLSVVEPVSTQMETTTEAMETPPSPAPILDADFGTSISTHSGSEDLLSGETFSQTWADDFNHSRSPNPQAPARCHDHNSVFHGVHNCPTCDCGTHCTAHRQNSNRPKLYCKCTCPCHECDLLDETNDARTFVPSPASESTNTLEEHMRVMELAELGLVDNTSLESSQTSSRPNSWHTAPEQPTEDQDPAEYHEPLLYDFHDAIVPVSFVHQPNKLYLDIQDALKQIDRDLDSLPSPAYTEGSCTDRSTFSEIDEKEEPFMAWSSDSEGDEEEIARQDYLEFPEYLADS